MAFSPQARLRALVAEEEARPALPVHSGRGRMTVGAALLSRASSTRAAPCWHSLVSLAGRPQEHREFVVAGALARNLAPRDIGEYSPTTILFLDEMTEFRRDAVEGLRQPHEESGITALLGRVPSVPHGHR
jgi:hypothetical protein